MTAYQDFYPNSFFGMLDPRLQNNLLARGKTKFLADGKVLYSEQDDTASFVIVLSGKIILSLANLEGENIFSADVKRGNCFGEATVLFKQLRFFQATASGDSEILELSRQAVQHFIQTEPNFSLAIIKNLATVLERTFTHSLEVVNMPVLARLARLLVAKSGGLKIQVRLTQTQLAQSVGCSRLKVHRALKILSDRGAILIHYGRLDIRNPDILRQIAAEQSGH